MWVAQWKWLFITLIGYSCGMVVWCDYICPWATGTTLNGPLHPQLPRTYKSTPKVYSEDDYKTTQLKTTPTPTHTHTHKRAHAHARTHTHTPTNIAGTGVVDFPHWKWYISCRLPKQSTPRRTSNNQLTNLPSSKQTTRLPSICFTTKQGTNNPRLFSTVFQKAIEICFKSHTN
jgi:hypothetical protein